MCHRGVSSVLPVPTLEVPACAREPCCAASTQRTPWEGSQAQQRRDGAATLWV